jgi:hypothetical protein
LVIETSLHYDAGSKKYQKIKVILPLILYLKFLAKNLIIYAILTMRYDDDDEVIIRPSNSVKLR